MLVGLALTGCVRHVAAPDVRGASAQTPPPGMVDVSVVAADEHERWNVYMDDRHICTTPCAQWFRQDQHLELEAPNGDWIYQPGFGPEAAEARRAILVAEGKSDGKFVNGIVFTALGGMSLVPAITLTAVGCSAIEERRGMCNAGLIIGGVALPLTAFAIWMLVDSGPRTYVLPVHEEQTAEGVTVQVAPTGIAGTF